MAKTSQEDRTGHDTDVDNYPTLTEALLRMDRDTKAHNERVRRLDLRFGANGEGFYRLWVERDEEHSVGHLPIA